MARVKDVPVLLDQLERWDRTDGHPLAGRLDLARVGMSGHSFDALTTQAVSGEAFVGRYATTNPRITAAIVFSPGSPRRGDTGQAFRKVAIPWLLMTGTRDVAPIGNADVASRLARRQRTALDTRSGRSLAAQVGALPERDAAGHAVFSSSAAVRPARSLS